MPLLLPEPMDLPQVVLLPRLVLTEPPPVELEPPPLGLPRAPLELLPERPLAQPGPPALAQPP